MTKTVQGAKIISNKVGKLYNFFNREQNLKFFITTKTQIYQKDHVALILQMN